MTDHEHEDGYVEVGKNNEPVEMPCGGECGKSLTLPPRANSMEVIMRNNWCSLSVPGLIDLNGKRTRAVVETVFCSHDCLMLFVAASQSARTVEEMRRMTDEVASHFREAMAEAAEHHEHLHRNAKDNVTPIRPKSYKGGLNERRLN